MLKYASCLIFFSLFLILVFNVHLSLAISCKDENNRDVDWFINYKLPKIRTEKRGSFMQTGRAYAYLSPSNPSAWKLSLNSIQSTKSMLGRTWQEFDNTRKNMPVGYLFYNDDAPGHLGHVAIGHLKGIVAFNTRSGFWLSHSIPRFWTSNSYEYPNSALINGQMAFCVTYNVSAFNQICKHLLYCNPNIYEYEITDVFHKYLGIRARTLFTKKPIYIRRGPFQLQSLLKSQDNILLYTFAKDNQLQVDIYSNMIAPTLETSLITETWRRGAGTFLDPYCESIYSVVDIVSIDMKVSNRKESIFFKSTEDHSKWAISIDASVKWVCIGDLNRMASQRRRGGGAICFQSKSIWKAFRSTISDTSQCPT